MFWTVWEELQALPRDPASFWACSWGSKVVVVVAVATVVYVVISLLFGRRKRAYNDPPNIVMLMNGPLSKHIPTPVPFGMKLETFCRMADIPYKRVPGMFRSSKGKMPFLRYNGQEVADSSFCIQFLNDTFHKDLNSKLSPEQRAVGRALTKMLEENTYWVLVIERLVDKPDFMMEAYGGPIWVLNYLFWLYVRRYVMNIVWYHGIGRHSRDELIQILDADIKAVSDYLGDKPFLFGPEPCEVDCAVFGLLSEALWEMEGTKFEHVVKEKYPNLRAYCIRMKERYWKDWDSIVPNPKEV